MNLPATPSGAPGLWARFGARFDDLLLDAPAASSSSTPSADCADADGLARALGALCQPGRPFLTAGYTLAATAGQRASQRDWLQDRLLTLDGTLHMLHLGGPWRQRLHRLAVKLRETIVDAESPPTGPWDCGLLKTDPAALRQAAVFTPRRPTLMVAWDLPSDTVASLVACLQPREASFARPVRLWALNGPARS